MVRFSFSETVRDRHTGILLMGTLGRYTGRHFTPGITMDKVS